MPVPDFQSLMLPVLKALAGGEEIKTSVLRERVAKGENLTNDDIEETYDGGSVVFVNRVSWAISHLSSAGLLAKTHHAVYRITKTGKQLLEEAPRRIDLNFLRKKYPKYDEYLKRIRVRKSSADLDQLSSAKESETDEDILDRVTKGLHKTLQDDILKRLHEESPSFFERFVTKLLVEMRYGDGDPARARVTGQPNDKGIDAIIREDALGLDKVCLQMKKNAPHNNVGSRDLRDFTGAIQSTNMRKGVFVTTSDFTKEAREYAENINKGSLSIILINGKDLAHLMIQHNVGVKVKSTFVVKQIDENYFNE